MQFIDTVTLFSAFFADEKHHFKSKKIVNAIVSGKLKGVVFSDYVLDELLTLARVKKGARVSNEILENIVGSEIEMLKVEQKHLIVAQEIFKKYYKLNFTDSTIVALMLDYGIRELYSFDKGFDSVPKIIRLGE
ncbi:MAG TPA: PIN domain-containing protein [archaeon]|nr:PIN domain-containing protein [archaeon]